MSFIFLCLGFSKSFKIAEWNTIFVFFVNNYSRFCLSYPQILTLGSAFIQICHFSRYQSCFKKNVILIDLIIPPCQQRDYKEHPRQCKLEGVSKCALCQAGRNVMCGTSHDIEKCRCQQCLKGIWHLFLQEKLSVVK